MTSLAITTPLDSFRESSERLLLEVYRIRDDVEGQDETELKSDSYESLSSTGGGPKVYAATKQVIRSIHFPFYTILGMLHLATIIYTIVMNVIESC